MLKIVLLDDEHCKKEFNEFLKRQKNSVKVIVPTVKISRYLQSLSGKKPERLALNMADVVYFIDPAEIIRCESNRNYTKLFLTGKRELMVSKNLMIIEKQLIKHENFVRIHKSHLINTDYIEKFLKTDGGFVVLKDHTRLPVSSRKKELLFMNLDKL